MFDEVIPEQAGKFIEEFSSALSAFYLAGGTGLALQLGHRKSLDLDFFSSKPFDSEGLLGKIQPEKQWLVREGTVHCEKYGMKISFLYYSTPLIYKSFYWNTIEVADLRDIAAEKIKAISQRGSKKDFYDVFAVIKLKLSLEDTCDIFKKRFHSPEINLYHVLKSMLYFEDADSEPEPILLSFGKDWKWEEVKSFFKDNIQHFERVLLTT